MKIIRLRQNTLQLMQRRRCGELHLRRPRQMNICMLCAYMNAFLPRNVKLLVIFPYIIQIIELYSSIE